MIDRMSHTTPSHNPPGATNAATDDAVLDAQTIALLLDAHGDDASALGGGSAHAAADDARLIARVGARLQAAMQSSAASAMAQASPQAPASAPPVRTIQPEQGTWRQILPGIERKTLHRDGDIVSVLLRMQAGAVLPGHAHARDEECVVMQGRIRVGAALDVAAGGFHWVAQGTPHEAIVALEDTVVYLRGALDAHSHA